MKGRFSNRRLVWLALALVLVLGLPMVLVLGLVRQGPGR